MYDNQQQALVALSDSGKISLLPAMANRHGLITGATGSGKTVSLQTMAETFSHMGVAVFAADVKGDLSGLALPGGDNPGVARRRQDYGLEKLGFAHQGFPVQLWDIFGQQGIPLRATVQDMGPLLLSHLLDLNDTQRALLSVLFKLAQDRELELVDLKDMRTLLEYAAQQAGALQARYGNMPAVSIGAIQRGLLAFENEGADKFFGEPSLKIDDLLQSREGKGVINILAAGKLMNSPRLYTGFLLWLINKLFAVLPEMGDSAKPKLVFFFDEAHLLFNEAPKVLLEKVEQVVRLIRSKGVGIYFISQSPADIPDSVLGQLGNRLQHALRAYTPKDQKALRAAAQSFRANPAFATELAISELSIGEALVSFLDASGAPRMVERAFIVPPEGRVGPLTLAERTAIMTACPLYGRYALPQERATAYERLPLTLNPKEQAAQRKAQEKQRQALAKQQQREEREKRRFWSGLLKTTLLPLFRQLLRALFR